MPNVNLIVGDDGSNTLTGTVDRDLIYGFNPDGPQSLVDTISATRVATGLTQPLFAVAPPGDLDRLFIVEKTGQIKILDLHTNQVQSTPFLDVSSQISSAGEQGLLGLAFDPDYAHNGYFYVNMSNASGDSEIRRYHVSATNPDVADPASATAILMVNQPDGVTNHKGGWLGFGPDGDLYAGFGDGGGGGDIFHSGQNMGSLLGKMLRVDVHADAFPADPTRNYAIPADNPFVGVAGAAPEIWALGLRNPWRPSFDRGTGDFYIADVGQDTWEEIDKGINGANYGWNAYEGPVAYPGGDPVSGGTLTFPIYSYNHTVGHSITGGYVYRGTSDGLQGQYFFADFIDDKFFTLHFDGTNWVATDRTSQIVPNLGAINNPSSFGEDGSGNLYVVDFDGDVFRLTPVVNSADQGDTLSGGGGDDMMFGGAGSDRLDGGTGADVLNGGSGFDYAVYASAAAGVVVDLAHPAANTNDAAGDTFILIEGLVGSALSDTLLGDDNANELQGQNGDDALFGRAGGDLLNGGAGNDRLFGDIGIDSGVFSGNLSASTVVRNGVLTTVSGPDGTDFLTSVESLQFSDTTLRNIFFTGDFNGDGNNDIALQNGSTPAEWLMNGTAIQAGSGVLPTLAAGWFAIGSGDFNLDGRSDLLLQNGQLLAEWLMNGTAIQAGSGVLPTLGAGWMVAGTGDFNNDGRSDILLQNGQQLAEWLMNGTALQPGSGGIGALGPGWAVAGTGDFNADGHSDILLQNGQQLALWEMNGTSLLAGSGGIGTLGAGWMVAGVNDFNHDGKADILLQNGQQLAAWLMNGTALLAGSGGIGTLGAGWAAAGTGDFNHDGNADILLQNGQQLAEWLMNGTALQAGSGGIGGLGAGWDLV